MDVASKIKQLITEKINTSDIEVIDESHKHRNHQKDTQGGHFKVLIISNDFNDISLINRHRLIYNILDKMIKVEIHALSIKALTKSENNVN